MHAAGAGLQAIARRMLVPYVPVLLQPRGSVGRSASLWDLNLRFTARLGAAVSF
jgi:hypothetical protein